MLSIKLSGSNGSSYHKQDLAAGILEENPVDEAGRPRRYPCLAKPAPHPWNSDIAPTFEEQLAKVFQPRPVRPLSPKSVKRLIATIQAHRQELRSALLDLLAEDIGIIVARILGHRRKRHGKKSPASL